VSSVFALPREKILVSVNLPYSLCVFDGGSSAARGGRAPPIVSDTPKDLVSVTPSLKKLCLRMEIDIWKDR